MMKINKHLNLLVPLVSALCAGASHVSIAEPLPAVDKTRMIVLTDIGNEPDDSQSFIRLLTYANEFDIESVIATTSTWQRDKVQPQLLKERVDAYAKVFPNLEAHAEGFPSPTELKSKIISGRAGFGMDYVGEGKSSKASKTITQIVDKADDRPVWITVWGGSVDLAQALWDVKHTRSNEDVAAFIRKIRVYSISDQDNTGAWIRRNFPTMTWISSLHAFNDYWLSTWIGISAPMAEGGDMSQVNNEWIGQHIQQGPLGSQYPDIMYIMEGDSPSFMYLLQNGLNVPDHPEYGGWGGRYAAVTYDDAGGLRTSTSDTVTGVDGKEYRNASATIWRFREQFQNDFAGRIQWTLTDDFSKANHNPNVKLNGEGGLAPVYIEAKSGEKVNLSATGSSDPDNDALNYRWWQYAEPSAHALQIHFGPKIELSSTNQADTSFVAPKVDKPTPFHVIIEVSDEGTPSLYSYRRAIITVSP
ncbi:nucleoside hydrolase-like domain-containing protein [Vibrio olivae]|uniref:Nucleoside hydrolase-like domain-containing protein n=1 Tax=Vibrio olivae TaxID=1243002 RepID=A0ABV5HHX2_9VIBR